MIRNTVVNAVRGVVTSAVSHDLPVTSLPTDALICYDKIVAIDFTTACTSVQIGFHVGADEVIVGGGTAVSANIPTVVEGKIYVPGQYRIFARFFGASVGDRIGLFVFGYTSDLRD
jgi:hypothetical protein